MSLLSCQVDSTPWLAESSPGHEKGSSGENTLLTICTTTSIHKDHHLLLSKVLSSHGPWSFIFLFSSSIQIICIIFVIYYFYLHFITYFNNSS